MDARDLRHAYAVLNLSPPVTEARLKRRYKALVRRWHPDRFQADPVGQAEATQRLRDINIAYDVVAESLKPVEPDEPAAPLEEVAPPADETERPFSWTPERVDEVVESINRMNALSVLPEMSAHRWFSIGAVLVYLIASSFILPAHFGPGARAIGRAVGMAFGYFWLPLFLIWSGDRDGAGPFESSACRIIGWSFMALPAIVGLVFLIAG